MGTDSRDREGELGEGYLSTAEVHSPHPKLPPLAERSQGISDSLTGSSDFPDCDLIVKLCPVPAH